MNPLLAVCLLFVGVLVVSRFSTADTATRLKYVLDSVGFSAHGILQLQVNVTIRIQNPTPNAFTIYALAGDLFVNDYRIGNISNFTPTTIAAHSETPYTIGLLIDTLSMPSTVTDLIQNFKGIKVLLNADVNVDNLTVPIQLEKNF